ncbi:MAG: hypothetical protein WCP53_08255, partial [Verrucomicrobiota bacterium]
MQRLAAPSGKKKTVLRPRREQSTPLLRDPKGRPPHAIRAVLEAGRQGAARILKPLTQVKLVKPIGTKKHGRLGLG